MIFKPGQRVQIEERPLSVVAPLSVPARLLGITYGPQNKLVKAERFRASKLRQARKIMLFTYPTYNSTFCPTSRIGCPFSNRVKVEPGKKLTYLLVFRINSIYSLENALILWAIAHMFYLQTPVHLLRKEPVRLQHGQGVPPQEEQRGLPGRMSRVLQGLRGLVSHHPHRVLPLRLYLPVQDPHCQAMVSRIGGGFFCSKLP